MTDESKANPQEGQDGFKRCPICDWPMKERAEDGCVPGNCSYRPHVGTAEWYHIQIRKEELSRLAASPAVQPKREIDDNGDAVQPGESTLPELDEAYQSQKAYGLTLPTGADYSVVESMARAQCRERQLLSTITALTAARAQVARWISVESELPPMGEDILFIVNGDPDAEKGLYLGNKWLSNRTDGYGDEISFAPEQVICWMPVPPYSAPAQETK